MNGLLAVPKGVGAETYRSVVAGVSAAYSMKRRVPTMAEIEAHCNNKPKTIARVISTPEFKALMKVRGFPMEEGPKLSPEQVFAVSIITDPTNKKPLAAKLKQAGITYPQYRAWLKQEHFREYVTKLTEDMITEHIGDVHTRLTEKATNGDIQAIKLYYEITGRHDPQRQQMVDLQGVIGLLLEIITRYVTDTNALRAITADVELVMAGGVPNALTSMDLGRIAGSDPATINGQVLTEKPVPDGFFDFETEAQP